MDIGFPVCALPRAPSGSIALIALLLLGTAGSAGAAQPLGCIIEPERVAEVGTPVAGIVESVAVERGDFVRKGQVLAVLRHDVERAAMDAAHSRAQVDAEVQAAKANFELARSRRARAEELHRKAFISAQALEQAVAEAQIAEQKLVQARDQQRFLAKDLNLAKARLDDRVIRSPIDGIVAERYVSAGERVEEKPLLRVAKIDPLRVEVVVPSALFGSIAAGTAARVVPDLPRAAPVRAKVSLVDRILDAPSGTFRVRLELPNPDSAIPAGLRCKIEFDPARPASFTPAPGNDSPELRMELELPANRLPGTKPRKM